MKLLLSLSLILLFPILLSAQSYSYHLTWGAPNEHTYYVTLEVRGNDAGLTGSEHTAFTDFKVPAWRPGRYYLQNYAASISHFEAKNAQDQPLKWHKVDKDTWRVMHTPLENIAISYRAFAANFDAGSSYVGKDQAYFNPVNFFMYIPGRLDQPVELVVPDLPRDWKVATALSQESDAYNRFYADSYHELVDSPTVLAKDIKRLTFKDDGVIFCIYFQGNYMGDKSVEEAAVKNIKKICQAQKSIFGSYPFDEFHFIYRLLPYDMSHAVEHETSVSFAISAQNTASPKAFSRKYGLTAHEFWHAWNVKRIRPAALWPYDYSQSQYTSLHWFTEGVTDYYALLTLVRTDLTSRTHFYRRLGGMMAGIANSSATQVVSPSQSSFDSWLNGSDYAHPNHATSYYGLGSHIGFVFDLMLRKESKGNVTLDHVFQHLYVTYYEQGKGVPEDGIQLAAEKLTGKSWQTFFDQHIHGTAPINYQALFAPFGLKVHKDTDDKVGIRRLGILRVQDVGQGLLVKRIHTDGDAYRDGLGLEDMILSIDGQKATAVELDEYFNGLKKGQTVNLEVFSDMQIRQIAVRFQGDWMPVVYEVEEKGNLSEKEEAMLNNWLGQ